MRPLKLQVLAAVVVQASVLISFLATTSSATTTARFLGVGYNLLTANPDGGPTSRGGIDPGILYTRKIFDVTQPHAVQSGSRSSCSRVKSTSVFYGAKSYQKKLKLGVSIRDGTNVGIAKFAFSMSPRFEQARHETSHERKVFQDDQVTCNYGRQRWAQELAHAYALSITQNFAAAVCRLVSFYDKHQYMLFLDQWGTHVTTQVELGYRNISRYQSSLSSFVEKVYTENSLDVQEGGAYMGYGASLSVDFDSFMATSSASSSIGTYQTTLVTGSPSMPEPIGLTVVPIHEALNSDYWQRSVNLTATGMCSQEDIRGLSAIRENLQRAVIDYPVYKKAVQPTDPELRIPLAWPRGTYGLYKPLSGCPSGGFRWYQGYRHQDSEDINTHNSYSNSFHLAGTIESDGDVETEFCIKGKTETTEFDLDWPKGDYCVLKYGNCPADLHPSFTVMGECENAEATDFYQPTTMRRFDQGWIKWDDEDDRNENGYGGYLPDGLYNEETLIYFCCRNDSLPTMSINLPNDKPFYLLRRSRSCQNVRGMYVTEEYLAWDEEWHLFTTNNQKYGGYHPFDDGNHDNHKLHFCYYHPISSV